MKFGNEADPTHVLPDYMSAIISKNIRWERREKKYSQDDFAKLLGVSKNDLVKIEQGKQPITAFSLFEIAEALEIEPDQLMEGASSVQINGDVTITDSNGNVGRNTNTHSTIGISEDVLKDLTSALNRMCDLLEQKNKA